VGIAEVRCALGGAFAVAFATELVTELAGGGGGGLSVRVALASAVPASEGEAVTVLCDVDQSRRSCAAH
jgi:hypothetical protein